MFRLPELTCADGRWRLPLTSLGAVDLAWALLTAERRARIDRFRELLSVEPGLVLWTLCRAPSFRDRIPGSLGELAEWLAEYAVSTLTGISAPELPDSGSRENEPPVWQDLAGRVPNALLRELPSEGADLAARWRAAWPNPVAWLSASGTVVHAEDVRDGRTCLPCWWTWSDDEFPAGERPLTQKTREAADAPSAAMEQRWSDGTRGPHFPIRRLLNLLHGEGEFAERLEREKLAALKQLAYGASHEINNPLANIATRAQALLAGESDAGRRQALSVIAAQAFRAFDMIADLMLFAHPPALKRVAVDLKRLAADVLAELRDVGEGQGTELRLLAQDAPTTALVDRDQIAVALRAICKNSLEALGQGGQVVVEVGVACSGDGEANEVVPRVDISVRDNGPGIPAEVRRHLFDPFYSGREAGRGLGFGLSKAWRIVTDHGGELRVTSEVGQGTEVRIELPRGTL